MSMLDRIEATPTVMGGRPRIRDTRVTVGTLLGLMAAGKSEAEILKLYPYITAEDLRAARLKAPADTSG